MTAADGALTARVARQRPTETEISDTAIASSGASNATSPTLWPLKPKCDVRRGTAVCQHQWVTIAKSAVVGT